MTIFEDGPAEGRIMNLSRAPVFLRVVENETGLFDALDKQDDEPRKGERIHVYILQGKPNQGFVDGRDPATGRRTGGCVIIARYRYATQQPEATQAADTKQWQAWCVANHKEPWTYKRAALPEKPEPEQKPGKPEQKHRDPYERKAKEPNLFD